MPLLAFQLKNRPTSFLESAALSLASRYLFPDSVLRAELASPEGESEKSQHDEGLISSLEVFRANRSGVGLKCPHSEGAPRENILR